MNAAIVLTVAQGKRLIARAVAQLPAVLRAQREGIIAIGRGTTNAYVAEAVLGSAIPKGEYVAGRTVPAGVPGEVVGRMQYPDIVLQAGQRLEGVSVIQAVEQMGPGDVFIKGANALNYAEGVAGVLVGHPLGGTVSTYAALIARKVELVIPIGLEKRVDEDLTSLSRASRAADTHPDAPVTALCPITGTIITELEALALLCGVRARLLASGGVAGAEGGIWLLLEGDREALDDALALHKILIGEPPFCG
jgi:hypothetical protein